MKVVFVPIFLKVLADFNTHVQCTVGHVANEEWGPICSSLLYHEAHKFTPLYSVHVYQT